MGLNHKTSARSSASLAGPATAHDRTPCISDLLTLLAALGAAALEAALTRWIIARGVADLAERVTTLDSKALRGAQGRQLPGVHFLAADCLKVEAVVAQLRVPGDCNQPSSPRTGPWWPISQNDWRGKFGRVRE